MICWRSWGLRLVAYSCSQASTAVVACWSPGRTSMPAWSGSWERVADTGHLVGLVVHEGQVDGQQEQPTRLVSPASILSKPHRPGQGTDQGSCPKASPLRRQ